MGISHSAKEIIDIIKRGIEKHEITPSEYENILSIADRDGYIDPQEKAAIAHLRDLIDDKTIRIKKSES